MRAAALAAVFVVLAVSAGCKKKHAPAPTGSGSRPHFELRGVDESADPLMGAMLGGSAMVTTEDRGFGSAFTNHYAYVSVPRGSDPMVQDRELRAAIAAISPPPGEAFAFGIDAVECVPTKVRTYVVQTPIATDADVESAVASRSEEDGHWSVLVAFDAAASQRFEEYTAAHVNQRLAIVVDDVVQSAPVIRSKIGGGRASITMSQCEPGAQEREAKRLAAALGGS